MLKQMKGITDQNLANTTESSKKYSENVAHPLEKILDSGEKIAKDLHFRLKDNEKLGKLISRIEKTKEEYYKQCKEFENIYTEQIILQDIENYYKSPQKAIVLKHELKGIHENLFQSKKRHELSINGYNEHAEFMINNIVTTQPPLFSNFNYFLAQEFRRCNSVHEHKWKRYQRPNPEL